MPDIGGGFTWGADTDTDAVKTCRFCGGKPNPSTELLLFMLACRDMLHDPSVRHVHNVAKAHQHAQDCLKESRK